MNRTTPDQISRWLDANRHRLDTPEALYGDEPNTFDWTPEQWDAATLRINYNAPFDYLQAIGNGTIPLLYQITNEARHPRWVAERSYFPTSSREVKMFEKAGLPLWGLETRHALGEYDLLGIPLNYPAYWVNAIKGLRLSGIPVRVADRVAMDEEYPLVVVGGHIFSNPWFISPTVDMVFCGEAEDETEEDQRTFKGVVYDDGKVSAKSLFEEPRDNPGWMALCDDFEEYKRRGMFYDAEGRERMLHELSRKYEFVFVPRFYKVIHKWVPDDPNEPVVVEAADGDYYLPDRRLVSA